MFYPSYAVNQIIFDNLEYITTVQNFNIAKWIKTNYDCCCHIIQRLTL